MATIQPLIHYALDLEKPPLLACDTPDANKYTLEASKVTCPRCMSNEQFPRMSMAIQPETPPMIRAWDVLVAAADLVSDDGENREYDRAIIELTSALIGAGPDDDILMARILRALRERD